MLRACALSLALLLSGAEAVGQEPAEEGPGYSRKGADTCLGCHDDSWDPPLMGLFQGPHANQHDSRSPFGEQQLQCEACHGPGGAHTSRVKRGEERPEMMSFGSNAETPVPQQNAMCLDCHQGHVGEHWAGSEHDVNEVACADCHVLHAGKDPVLDAATQADTCYSCHANQKSDFWKPNAHPVRFGKMTCSSCHQPHGSDAEALLVRQTVNDTCYSCHAEKRGPLLWEHAPVPEDCGNCHDPHGSVHPALLEKRPPLLCQQCHSPAGHPSVPYTEESLAGGTPSPFVLSGSCLNCHQQVHGSNHPSGKALMR